MPQPEVPNAHPQLTAFRQRIDGIDDRILDLLAQRAAVVQEVAAYKHAHGLEVFVPHREQAILRRLVEAAGDRFPAEGVVAVFREVISACRALEHRPQVAYLGPAGTFAEMAAHAVWGDCATFLPQRNFADIFLAVEKGTATVGVVPVENSTAGTIREVLDLLADTTLYIIAETHVDVHHCLLANCQMAEVDVVYSKDTALEQCKRWLDAHLPRARRVGVESTAAGAERATREANAAGIAPSRAAEVYGLTILADHIEDRGDNRTRFFALGKQFCQRTGDDKTSLLLSIKHRPGALVQALEVLRRHGLNMTLIESRPFSGRPFEYVFFIDIEGHRDDAHVAAALAEFEDDRSLLRLLGSYPRSAA